jgi:methionyl-tRNA formyltransferase
MKFVFLGGKESAFAQIILDGLASAGWKPVASIRDAKSPIDAEYLRLLEADFFIVAAFGKILKKEIIDIPPKGVIGVHPSLLPKYRGPSPIQAVILNDEKETGTTLFLIDEKIDHGPILAQRELEFPISNFQFPILSKKLAELGVDLLIETLPKFVKSEIKPMPQNEAEATYTKKFTSEDAQVDLTRDDPRQIWLKIRALNPEPGVFTILELKNDKKMRLKLLEADFKSGRLELIKVQPEGKKPMNYQSFLNGYRNQITASA